MGDETTAATIIPPQPLVARSPKWPALRDSILERHPLCAGCGRKATTVHHLTPVNVHPGWELLEANLVSVCQPCHFVIGHAGDWALWVTTAVTDLERHRKVVDKARELAVRMAPLGRTPGPASA